jgi:hypothetical protein
MTYSKCLYRHVVISGPYTKGSVGMEKGGFLIARPAMKSLLVGPGHYLYKVYNYHDSRVYGYKRSEILPRIDVMVLGREWYWIEMSFGVVVWSCVIYSNPFMNHTLW